MRGKSSESFPFHASEIYYKIFLHRKTEIMDGQRGLTLITRFFTFPILFQVFIDNFMLAKLNFSLHFF